MIIQPGAAVGLWPHSRECEWQNLLRNGKGVELVAGEFDRHIAGSVISSLISLQRLITTCKESPMSESLQTLPKPIMMAARVS
jgi:hypothetical protein